MREDACAGVGEAPLVGEAVPPTARWLVWGPSVAEAPAESAQDAPMSSRGRSPAIIEHLLLTAISE